MALEIKRIQLRRDTLENWTTANPILAEGEYGYETDTGYERIGDGSTAFLSLPIRIGALNGKISLDSVSFDTGAAYAVGEGEMAWNAEDNTLDVGLSDGTVLQMGQEMHIHAKAAEALTDAEVVYASGAVGASGKIEVSKFIADNSVDEIYMLGVVTHDIASGAFGYVTTFGAVRGVPTDGAAESETWIDGTVLYASPTVAGKLTNVVPVAPDQSISVAMVIVSHASNGTLYVRPSRGLHISELHDVHAPAPSEGDILKWATDRWANVPLAIVYDDYDAFKASTEVARPVGSIVRYGQHSGVVVASGGNIQNSAPTPMQLDVLPDLGGRPNLKAFGVAGEFGVSLDETAGIQAWINATLAAGFQTLYAPSGQYQFTSLTFRNAAGSGRELHGKITIKGDGQLSQADVFGSTNQRYGTIFESTLTTADNAFIVSDNNTQMRSVRFEGVTLIYGGTGYALQVEYCPEVDIEGLSIRLTAAGSKAAFFKDVWHGRAKRLIAICDTAITSTTTGVTFEAGLFAGSFKFEDCIIDHFNDNVYVPTTSANFVNLVFENCSIQKYHRYGWFIEGPMWNFTLRDCYTESGAAVTPIKIDPAAGSVENFRIDGLFILGGTTTAAWLTGPVIEIDTVDQYTIKNIKYFRPWTSLMNVGASVGAGTVEGVGITHDNSVALPAGPLYMFTADASHRFAISSSELTNTSKLALVDESSDNISIYDSDFTRAARLSFGATVFPALAAGTYDMHSAKPQPVVAFITATGGGASAIKLPVLPSGNQNGDVRYVYNDAASTQPVIVRLQDNTNIGVTLAAGEGCICHGDTVNNKWIVSKTSGTVYGP